MVAGWAWATPRDISLLSERKATLPRVSTPTPPLRLEQTCFPRRRPISMPKVLVTGGAGFIGSHVADLFLAKDWEVAIVDDLSSGKRENIPAAAKFHEIGVNSPELVRL